jgi:ABC-type Zn uptake system ZnuABC Zn-binding protein ZnuA
LDALHPELGEISPMNSDEYKATMKEYDDELGRIDQPPAAQRVFTTMTKLV